LNAGGIQTAPRGLLIDLDGTMYHGGRMIDGANELIAQLRRHGIPFLFVTNNSSASPEIVAGRLSAMGIASEAREVVTSAQAAAAYIAARTPGATVFVIGEDGLLDAVRGAGLALAASAEEPADYVLQGIDRQFTYAKLAEAVNRIRAGAGFVLTNPDLLLPAENGFQPGAGSIGAAIAASSGARPVVIGKPSSVLMDYALDKLGVPPAGTWVVGDNLATDIAAGAAAGCATALVLTGLTTEHNMEHYAKEAGVRPDAVFGDLRMLMEELEARMG